jgi:hypothetical protein
MTARHFSWAALAGVGLLLSSNLPFVSTRLHAYLSAVPLAVAGLAYAMLQFRIRPARETLLKRLLLAATFMVWAVDQLLSSRWASVFIGDVVIAAYVLDLHWLIQEQTATVQHSTLTEQLHRAVVEKQEFDDGFALRISSSQFPPSRVIEWITLEQRGCPSVAFELRFDADQGAVWLHLRRRRFGVARRP